MSVRDADHRQFIVRWRDAGAEPQVAPNPLYPEGKDVDISAGAGSARRQVLPYPARRIGAYLVECKLCGIRVGVTTAGRSDDPRCVTIACKL